MMHRKTAQNIFGILLLVAALLIPGAPAMLAQSSDTSGTDFWVTFPSNLGVTFATLNLFIAGTTSTSGMVSIPAISFTAPFTVTAGQVTTITIPIGAELETTDVVENKGIHVTAGSNVTVYGLSSDRVPGFFSTDGYLALPTPILGTDYVILAYQTEFGATGFGSQLDIVAAANGTTVTITPSATVGNHPAGVPYTVMMIQGQTYQLDDSTVGGDLTGTTVTSNQPIAVYGGNQCADIPQGFNFCNVLIEELPPTPSWGQNFLSVPLATRTGGDTFRYLASKNGTHVSVNGAVVATLNRGQFFEQNLTAGSQITSDQPILVGQYAHSGSFDGTSSDPFLMIVPPAAQYLASYTVSTATATQFPGNFANITVQTAGVGHVSLDGTPIAGSTFTPIGTSGFSGAQVALTVGSHNLTGTFPFGAVIYGFSNADGYGYVAGFSLSPIALVTSVALTPPTSSGSIGTPSCVIATVTDQNNSPVAGVRVDFAVTGVNPMAGFTTAGANGQAQFCYSGTVAGADTVTGAVGSIMGTAMITWSNPTLTSPGTFAPAPGSSTQVSMPGGNTAQFNLMLTPAAGASGPVTFTVTVSPNSPTIIVSVSPTSGTLTGSTPITLTVTLRTNCIASLAPPAPIRMPPMMPPQVVVLWLLSLLGLAVVRKFAPQTRLARVAPAVAMLLLTVIMPLFGTGCGSGNSIIAVPGQPTTPPGLYTITVTATSGMAVQKMQLFVRVV
jgi:hypothetical protein